MTTTTPPVIYPPGSTPPHAETSLGSKEFNPKIPIESEECNSMPPNGKSCWFPVGYRGEALLSVGADIWFSPRAESGDELRPFDHNHGRSGDHGRTRNLCLLPRIDPTGFMRVKMNIALRKRTLSPVRLVLEDSSKRSFMLFVVVSLQLGSII